MIRLKETQVLLNLRPNGGWIITNGDFDTIQWVDCEPITKAEFDAELAIINQKMTAEAAAKEAARQALLDKLGITADEAKLLLG